MDTELTLKLVASALGVIGTLKLLYDWAALPRGRMREHYAFARDFLKELEDNPAMHPYLVENGFQAIAGTRSITATEARYIISLEPITTLSDYVFARPCLHVIPSGPGWVPEFRGKYAAPRSRFWRKLGYLVVYSVAALAPFWLFILGTAHVLPRREAFQLAITACGLWPVAYLAMLEAARIARAEDIVNRARSDQKASHKSAAENSAAQGPANHCANPALVARV